MTQTGFSLIELMVGLVIGLLTTLVIMQVFSVFEGQKRSTTGTADAQTSGSVALFSLQRDIQLAGFGLPLIDTQNQPLSCTTSSFTLPATTTPTLPAVSVNLTPITITDGGTTAGASDVITVRYGTSSSAGVPTNVIAPAGTLTSISAMTNIGCKCTVPDTSDVTGKTCQDGDIVFVVRGNDCKATRLRGWDGDGEVKVLPAVDVTVGDTPGESSQLSCVGRWNQVAYQMASSPTYSLNKNGTPIVDGIVNIQAQYGISASPNANQIASWVNATGNWATPGNSSATCNATNANINCIKAVRVAVVARNGLYEKEVVTSAAPTSWAGGPTINLTNITDWDHYRYKVYESVIPLRNIVWAREQL
ncbi:MAG TPA: PilW family protein [Methylotenera sp.]|nr:PilW family protein [Methylotenera sp.]HPH05689.1 PilW family protein [Methylotenera sp.]